MITLGQSTGTDCTDPKSVRHFDPLLMPIDVSYRAFDRCQSIRVDIINKVLGIDSNYALIL